MMRLITLLIIIVPFFCVAQEESSERDFFKRFSPDRSYSYDTNNDLVKARPIPFQFVREADVMWQKVVWQVVDLKEKINLPIYYPTYPLDGYKNLISVLMEGIEKGEIIPYDARTPEEFTTPLTPEQVKEQFGAESQKVYERNFDTGEMEERVVAGEIRTEEVKQLLIKELWYFNKHTSSLESRIIGLCPIREYYMDENDPNSPPVRTKVFWVHYPEARNLLARSAVFNGQNPARKYSYDDIFINRFFNSYITREENVYNSREITSYLSGREAMRESQRIKNEIFDFEQDLWEY